MASKAAMEKLEADRAKLANNYLFVNRKKIRAWADANGELQQFDIVAEKYAAKMGELEQFKKDIDSFRDIFNDYTSSHADPNAGALMA